MVFEGDGAFHAAHLELERSRRFSIRNAILTALVVGCLFVTAAAAASQVKSSSSSLRLLLRRWWSATAITEENNLVVVGVKDVDPSSLTRNDDEDNNNEDAESDLRRPFGGSSPDCTQEAWQKLTLGTYAYAEREADCGSGYAVRGHSQPYHVVLLGDTLGKTYRLTGCKLGQSSCPLNPQCTISWTPTLSTKTASQLLLNADVIMVTNFEQQSSLMKRAVSKSTKRVRRVLQWREAYWPYISPASQQQDFDLVMGVHLQSHLLLPAYVRRPHMMLRRRTAGEEEERPPSPPPHLFAMSIVSSCHTSTSARGKYLQHLVDYLGRDRVHQYGACGDESRRTALPPPPINRARKVISQYKFFFSFENTMSEGYVSEKLFTVLEMKLVPVYLGGSSLLNITTTPAFINAFDFASPQKLAEYLVFLDANPAEYAKYHAWRTSAEPFTRDYLALVRDKFPGQQELRLYGTERFATRRAVCCRLCDEEYLRSLASTRRVAIQPPMGEEEINRVLFAGKMNTRPGAGNVLTAAVEEEEEGNA